MFTAHPVKPELLSRHLLTLLVMATAIGSLGLAAGTTAGALLAVGITGSESSAGLALGALAAGAALGAFIISRTPRLTTGLIVGYLLGAAGAVIVVVAAMTRMFPLLLAGTVGLGAANPAVARYAGADLGGKTAQGRAMGTVLFATAAGAVLSPLLVGPSGHVAAAMGLPPLTGLYLIAVPAFVIAAAVLAVFTVEAHLPAGTHGHAVKDLCVVLCSATARAGMILLATVNLVMVGIMAIAPVHLTQHGHDLGAVGIVVGVHVMGMYVPSPVTGWAADRFGAVAVAAAGIMLMVAAGLATAVLDQSSGPAMAIALGLLGIGWNAGVVSGSIMIAAGVPAAVRPRAEGIGELGTGIVAAATTPIAGMAAAYAGFTTLALVAPIVAVLALVFAVGHRVRTRATSGEG